MLYGIAVGLLCAINLFALGAASGDQLAEQDFTPAKLDYSCSEAITIVNANPIDEMAIQAYADEACFLNETNLIQKDKPRITVIVGPLLSVMTDCAIPHALACTKAFVWGSTGRTDYLILIPTGMPGAMIHELSHVIYLERGVPPGPDYGADHHKMMAKTGTLWLD